MLKGIGIAIFAVALVLAAFIGVAAVAALLALLWSPLWLLTWVLGGLLALGMLCAGVANELA